MIDLYGIAGILTFYSIVLVVGIWAGTKQKNHGEEEVMLAGRSIGKIVGVLTLIATWGGGSYFTGTAESLFSTGLLWCQAPVGYSLTLVAGALIFAKPMRDAGYITMLDPFQKTYGRRIGGLLFLPALLGDMLYLSSVLSSLGVSLKVILGISDYLSVTISTMFAVAYTISGGLYSVSYTDVLQLIFIVFGLLISVPFAIVTAQDYPIQSNGTLPSPQIDWLGHVEPKFYPQWTESMIILILGGIPCQSYFQRILSLKSSTDAVNVSLISATACFFIVIPAAIIGVLAKFVDWSKIPGYDKPFDMTESNSVLPLVLRYLTPGWVTFFGLGAVSASVMSSADSVILGSGSMFTRNIYHQSFRPKASEYELMWVLRLSILAASVISCSIALSGASIYYLSVVCSDVVYVTLFPQLVLVVHGANHVNSYGCLSSVVIGILLRITGGEPNLGLPALIKYPWYDYQLQQQLFPFKTMAMLLSAASHLLISKLAAIVFEKKLLSTERWDVLNAFPDVKTKKCPSIVTPLISREQTQNYHSSSSRTLEGTNNMGFS
ncbi:hypothetical protein M8J75_003151 [Diaphorina citri]|nr:hypothetical protein M8J75_003151 [Diaphorina citri]KAI5739326.1 hypothetical protein M8J77_017935 [Diaphorina citri]